MTRNGLGLISLVGSLAGVVALSFAPRSAHAEELEACGGIFAAKGEVSCEIRPREECMTSCTTEEVQGACVAKVNTMCEGRCTQTATATCESTCNESCTTECTQQEAAPSCGALCVADCKATCDGFCEGDGPCNACCAHNCDRKCARKCKDAPEPEPAVACETHCTEACSGSCTAQATVQCQLDCQTEVIEECETEMVETCETTCEEKGAAIFCDGQFVNASSLESCVSELSAELEIDLDLQAAIDIDVNIDGDGAACPEGGDDDDGDGKCDEGNESIGEELDKVCTVSRVRGADLGAGAALFSLLTGLAIARIRRRRG